MMVSQSDKFVFLGVPKTGTRSIHKWLEESHDVELLGDHKHRVDQKHTDYFKWMVVRNPYDRMWSIYWSCCRKAGDVKGFVYDMQREGLHNCFLDFLIWINRHHRRFSRLNHSKYLILKNQTVFLSANPDTILHYEHLKDSICRLPFVKDTVSLPRMNVSGYSKIPTMTRREILLINKYCHDEFRHFHYTRR